MSSEVEVTRGNHNGIDIPGIIVKNKEVVSQEEQLLINKSTSGTEKERKLLAFLNEYTDVMKVDRDHGDQGNSMQTRLYRVYVDIIENSNNQEFRSLWAILLLFAKLNKNTVFRSDMINRYSYLWDIGEEKIRCFQMVNNIVLLTLDPETRQRNVKRQIDFGKSLDKFFSQEAAQRVVGFYKT